MLYSKNTIIKDCCEIKLSFLTTHHFMKSFIWFIILLEFVLSDLPVWDSNRYIFEAYLKSWSLKSKYYYKENPSKRIYNKDIKALDYIILRNLPIITIDVTNYESEELGIVFEEYKSSPKQTITMNYNKDYYLIESSRASCHLSFCEIGLFFYHYSVYGQDIVTKKVTDFAMVLYVMLTSESGIFYISKLAINQNHYPLMVCPYTVWTTEYGKVKFHPFVTSGIEYASFRKRHILAPIYPQAKYEGNFIFGEIEYVDETKLKVGFQLDKKYGFTDISVGMIGNINENIVCLSTNSEKDYIYFTYNDLNKDNIE
uniref:Peptidase A1 domain-containing protein n=1 Tax=Parastrongyloides trichosuri TaxID=131310 RepID=A0A0N4ZJU6_PARTI